MKIQSSDILREIKLFHKTNDYNQLHEYIKGICLNYLQKIPDLSYEDIEDIIQETSFSFYKNIDKIDNKRNSTSYISQIVCRKAIDHFRKKTAKKRTCPFDETLFKKMLKEFGLEDTE